MTGLAKMMKLIGNATENGRATENDLMVKRCKQRFDHEHLHHTSAYGYRFYIDGKRVSRETAIDHLAT